MFDFLNLALMGLQDPMKMATQMAMENIAPPVMQEAIGSVGNLAQPTMAAGGAAAAGGMAPGGSVPQPAVPMAAGAGANPIGASGPGTQVASLDNSIFDGFMNTVKGGVTNPYGQAAVAATGMRETTFSAGNAFRSWDDVGKPAGGIMSWRGPRLQALQQFAGTTDMKAISPEIQGQFFLQEDPSLIAKLNAAGSDSEAMTIMNNAWQFKGFNDANSPEFKARMQAVNKIAPLFGGGGSQTPGTGDMSVSESMAATEADKANRAGILAGMAAGAGAGGTVTGNAASGQTQSIPPTQTLADKLAMLGKGLKIPEGNRSEPQGPPKIVGGLAPNVGGGFGRNPQSMEQLFAMLGGNVSPQPQVPSLSQLIKGG